MKTKRINKKKIIKLLLYLVLCYSLTQIAIWLYKTENSKQEYSKLEKEVLISRENDAIGNETKEENAIIDFEKLSSINYDTKGWLTIEKLDISYPIMQSKDNEYYLSKNIYGENSISGSIFLDYRNNGFQDNNTILYGHTMQNGTMFGKLENIMEGKLGTDIDIFIYTKDKIYKYKVVSAYEIKPNEFKINENIDKLIGKSKIDFQKDVDKNSRYLTLYTCTKTATKRVIVHAILENNP